MLNTTKAADSGQTTAVPSIATAASVATILPEWIRLPKGGSLCPWTGLSRSKVNEVVLPCKANGFKPPVKSAVLRQKGALKGVRLIHLQSLLNFIEQHVEGAKS